MNEPIASLDEVNRNEFSGSLSYDFPEPSKQSESVESDVTEMEVDCPICLDPMHSTDHAHPLQCSRLCGYNFCLSCIESLIESSKDDYMEASDGNYHVKVFLHCPNCRSDLSESIRDTVLLRRASEVRCREENNESLSSRQKRMKQALERDDMVRSAVAEAARREADFFGLNKEEDQHGYEDEYYTYTDFIKVEEHKDDAQQQYEEWGVEADVVRGAHDSFHFPSHSIEDLLTREEPKRKLTIDITLLQGLDYFLSKEEQESLTDLFTSGDPTKVAIAAEALREVSNDLTSNGGKRTTGIKIMTASRKSTSKRHQRSHRGSLRGSIYQLVSEAQRAHMLQEEKSVAPMQVLQTNTATTRRREEIRYIQQQAEYLKLHPLPVRMPKAVQLQADGRSTKKQPALEVSLVDDTWDGTVLDAFSKVTVSRIVVCPNRYTIRKKQPNHNSGVRHILGASNGAVRIALDQPRIVVAAVYGNAGKQGVVKGDVVTHWNGQPVPEDETAESLTEKLQHVSSCGRIINLTLNADEAIAQALKRRAFAD